MKKFLIFLLLFYLYNNSYSEIISKYKTNVNYFTDCYFSYIQETKTVIFNYKNKKDNKEYIQINDKIYCIYEGNFHNQIVSPDKDYIIITYWKDKKIFLITTNGKKYGPFDSIDEIKFLNNNYYFTFCKNNKKYLLLNNKEYRIDSIFSNENSFYFYYKDNNKLYLNINNKIFKCKTQSTKEGNEINVQVTNDFKNFYIIQKKYEDNNDRDEKYFLNINNNLFFGPYSGAIENVQIINKNISFNFSEKNKKFTYFNSKIYENSPEGHYKNVFYDRNYYKVCYSEDGLSYGFSYKKDDKITLNINGIESSGFDSFYK